MCVVGKAAVPANPCNDNSVLQVVKIFNLSCRQTWDRQSNSICAEPYIPFADIADIQLPLGDSMVGLAQSVGARSVTMLFTTTRNTLEVDARSKIQAHFDRRYGWRIEHSNTGKYTVGDPRLVPPPSRFRCGRRHTPGGTPASELSGKDLAYLGMFSDKIVGQYHYDGSRVYVVGDILVKYRKVRYVEDMVIKIGININEITMLNSLSDTLSDFPTMEAMMKATVVRAEQL